MGATLLPGYIDAQVNGGGGYLFNNTPDVHALAEIARAHGCDHVILYREDDVARRVRELTDGTLEGFHEDLRALAEDGELTWHRRGFRPDDVAGAWLVLAHTDSPAVQDLVTRTAEQHRVFCVTGGDAAASSAWVPAVTRAHGVTVAVNAGGDPRRAKAVTAWIAARLETGEIPVRARRSRPDASSAAKRTERFAVSGITIASLTKRLSSSGNSVPEKGRGIGAVSRPASTPRRKALAIATGSAAFATAVLSSTAS